MAPPAPPLLVVVSGPSGVGKDVAIKRLKSRGVPFHFQVTCTTRSRRAGEVDGVDYHFISSDQFDQMIARGEFLEYAVIYEQHRSGNSRREIQEALARGEDVILRIDVQGAKTIRRKVQGAVLIFLTASFAQLEKRLRARHSEPEQALQARLRAAEREMKEIDLFDYVVVNRDEELDKAVDDILSIIRAEKLRVRPRRLEFLEE